MLEKHQGIALIRSAPLFTPNSISSLRGCGSPTEQELSRKVQTKVVFGAVFIPIKGAKRSGLTVGSGLKDIGTKELEGDSFSVPLDIGNEAPLQLT